MDYFSIVLYKPQKTSYKTVQDLFEISKVNKSAIISPLSPEYFLKAYAHQVYYSFQKDWVSNTNYTDTLIKRRLQKVTY